MTFTKGEILVVKACMFIAAGVWAFVALQAVIHFH